MFPLTLILQTFPGQGTHYSLFQGFILLGGRHLHFRVSFPSSSLVGTYFRPHYIILLLSPRWYVVLLIGALSSNIH